MHAHNEFPFQWRIDTLWRNLFVIFMKHHKTKQHYAVADPGRPLPFSKIITNKIYDKVGLLTKEVGKENSCKC